MKVKICGVTDPDDACYSAEAGADYIGIIFSKKSKRKINLKQAKKIYSAVQNKGTELVGVFVDETAEEILTVCDELHLNTIQLHGTKSKEQLRYLQDIFTIFYAVSAEKDSSNTATLHHRITPLFDHNEPGSGQTFNWDNFTPPNRPWILAGGLNTENVSQAIQLLKPHMVDVASGVERINSIRKEYTLVSEFIQRAKQEI